MSSVGVVLVAAGSGERLGTDGPKALVEVAGQALVAHALGALAAAGLPPAVVVYPPEQADAFARAARATPVAGWVPGGATRTASVRAGVGALPDAVTTVVVHDAARPLMPSAVIRSAVEAVADTDDGGTTDDGDLTTGDAVADVAEPVLAAAPGLPIADTVKRTEGRDIVATVDRRHLVGIQTPQVFARAALDAALATGDDATDELGLVERLRADGHLHGRVVVTPGSAWGRKVTYDSDLAVVEALAAAAPALAPVPDGTSPAGDA